LNAHEKKRLTKKKKGVKFYNIKGNYYQDKKKKETHKGMPSMFAFKHLPKPQLLLNLTLPPILYETNIPILNVNHLK
jgi:hypothetical protein